MRELNEKHVYSLTDLTNEEYNIFLKETDNEDVKQRFNYYYHAFFSNILKEDSNVVNAKELFYTLENIQVDCRYLTNEQIKEMADIFENNGYDNSKIGLEVKDIYFLLRQRWDKDDRNFSVLGDHKDDRFTTITYDKFMELFGSKSEQNVEVSKEFCKLLTEEISRQPTQEEIASIFSCDNSDVYSDIKNLIEKGKQQGLKIVVTFEKL